MARHLHARNQVDSRPLMVRSQTVNLTPGLSFGHNLCFKCPNGWYEPILNIYVSIAFWWYNELFKTLGFWPLQSLSEHSGVHRDSNSQHGNSLGSVRVLSLTLFFTPGGMKMWLPGLILACTLSSPFCLGRKPKVRVATILLALTY